VTVGRLVPRAVAELGPESLAPGDMLVVNDPHRARDVYGACIDPGAGSVDTARTAERRATPRSTSTGEGG